VRILVYSTTFHPRIGGLETVVRILAEELVALGETVQVVTLAEGALDELFPFEVVRQPSPARLLALVRESDVVFHHNISLKAVWPVVLARKPWVVTHHTTYGPADRPLAWRDRLKQLAARYAVNVAISNAVRDRLQAPSVVIPNPYQDDVFRMLPGAARDREIACVGRLVSDKGVDCLLDALGLLAARGLRPGVSIVGDGPEREPLAAQAARLGIRDQVDFRGTVVGEDLCRLLNAHRILAVPSRWDEPFGIVALEGIACGNVVIGSCGGGLAEAIGPCGRTFPNGDAAALAGALEAAMRDRSLEASLQAHASAHLARHSRRSVAAAYLGILEKAVRDRSEVA
jgi:glycogen(starch) synthase